MSRRIGLVGCVKQKGLHAATAAELYTSALFRGRRAYVERTCDSWFVLSALHGLLEPQVVVAPYDVTLAAARRPAKREWSKRALAQIDKALGPCADATFEIHAGSAYMNFGLADGLAGRGASLEWPVAGLRLGEQLAFYAADR